MTDSDKVLLEELKVLCEKATPEPWYSYEGDLMTGPLTHGYGPKLGSFNFIRTRHGKETPYVTGQAFEDSHFVEKSRSAIPRLLAIIESLQATKVNNSGSDRGD